jgi:uncharacterized protein
MNSSEFLNKINSTIRQFDKNAEIILYGSRARGDFRPDSDWDILILLDTSVDENLKEKIRDGLFEIELETNQVITSIIKSKKRWKNLFITPLHKNIDKEGIRI